jgi:hypothetical protein
LGPLIYGRIEDPLSIETLEVLLNGFLLLFITTELFNVFKETSIVFGILKALY